MVDVPEGPRDEFRYNPEYIDRQLCRWQELAELAIPTPGSTSHFSADGPWRGGGKPCDPQRYADLIADIERAWIHLGHLSLEFKAVDCVMRGMPLREIDRIYRFRHGTASEAYGTACRKMAITLGWQG